MLNNWISIALMCTLFSSLSVILMKYIDNSNYNNVIFMVISYIVVGLFGIIYLIYDFKNKKEIIKTCDYKLILYSTIFAFIIVIGNIVIQYAFSISPNISYTHLIINLNIIFTIIASYVLFNQYINIYCFLGMIISFTGILIIMFNYRN
jgi:drug/metabolite transporter (DMT)-like permease